MSDKIVVSHLKFVTFIQFLPDFCILDKKFAGQNFGHTPELLSPSCSNKFLWLKFESLFFRRITIVLSGVSIGYIMLTAMEQFENLESLFYGPSAKSNIRQSAMRGLQSRRIWNLDLPWALSILQAII